MPRMATVAAPLLLHDMTTWCVTQSMRKHLAPHVHAPHTDVTDGTRICKLSSKHEQQQQQQRQTCQLGAFGVVAYPAPFDRLQAVVAAGVYVRLQCEAAHLLHPAPLDDVQPAHKLRWFRNRKSRHGAITMRHKLAPFGPELVPIKQVAVALEPSLLQLRADVRTNTFAQHKHQRHTPALQQKSEQEQCEFEKMH